MHQVAQQADVRSTSFEHELREELNAARRKETPWARQPETESQACSGIVQRQERSLGLAASIVYNLQDGMMLRTEQMERQEQIIQQERKQHTEDPSCVGVCARSHPGWPDVAGVVVRESRCAQD